MNFSESCIPNIDPIKRSLRYKIRKLHLLKSYKDYLERRISAVCASIETLEEQIQRDRDITQDQVVSQKE